MKIRFAIEKDVCEIIELCKQHALYEKTEYDTANKELELTKALFLTNPVLMCLVAEDNGKIIGYATFMKQFSTWGVNFYVYLDCLFLKSNYRSKGLGKQLMNEIKTYAKKENCNLIQWQTPSFNKRAIEFYLKNGATPKNKERFFLEV